LEEIMELFIIFDLDGTLVDSEMLCNQAFKDLIPEIKDSIDLLMKMYKGKKLSEIMCDIESRYHIKLYNKFENIYRKYVADLFTKNLQPTSGTIKMLENIENKYCLASSVPIEKIRHSLRISGLEKYFQSNIFSSYEVNSWKPDPGLFLFAAHSMNIIPEKCIVIEDSDVGIIAAKEAKIKYLKYGPELKTRYSEEKNEFRSMNDLINILKNIETKSEITI
jgi:HAD superfamily hydrolase (TIGR01509 family)